VSACVREPPRGMTKFDHARTEKGGGDSASWPLLRHFILYLHLAPLTFLSVFWSRTYRCVYEQ